MEVKLLLDTSAWSAFAEGHPHVAARVRAAGTILMSAVVVGELLYGIHNGARAKQTRRLLSDFLVERSVEFLPVGYETADWFGRLGARQRKAGRPIASNDLWIAAHALEHGASLLTFDQGFASIEPLSASLELLDR